MTNQMEGQMSLFDLDTWYGKTSPEPSAATVAKTSKPSSRKSSGSSSQNLPMCLCLTRVSGQSQDVSTMSWEDGALLGEYTTHSFGESPREENASRLSQILEDSAHQKYYLSAKAVLGILTRACKRGKELPDVLYHALVNQSGLRSKTYGQTEIADAGEVLRALREEIGETVCYRIGSYCSNSMKSSNPHSGIYQTEISNTLDNMNCGYPACHQGGVCVVEIHNTGTSPE